MAQETIREGFEVFASETGKPFGAVRRVSPHGRSELVIYVENSGEHIVPARRGCAAVHRPEGRRLTLAKLDKRLPATQWDHRPRPRRGRRPNI